jgi:hypothetical protein
MSQVKSLFNDWRYVEEERGRGWRDVENWQIYGDGREAKFWVEQSTGTHFMDCKCARSSVGPRGTEGMHCVSEAGTLTNANFRSEIPAKFNLISLFNR